MGFFSIGSIPTLKVFREKVIPNSQAGALPAAALAEMIPRVREVDMEAAHRRIAEHDSGHG